MTAPDRSPELWWSAANAAGTDADRVEAARQVRSFASEADAWEFVAKLEAPGSGRHALAGCMGFLLAKAEHERERKREAA